MNNSAMAGTPLTTAMPPPNSTAKPSGVNGAVAELDEAVSHLGQTITILEQVLEGTGVLASSVQTGKVTEGSVPTGARSALGSNIIGLKERVRTQTGRLFELYNRVDS